MILDATNKSLEIILAGAVATTQLPFVATYADITTTAFTPTGNDGRSNDAVAVTMVPAPAASTQRQVKEVSVYNSDTAPATVTVRLNDAGTFRIIVKVILQVGEHLQYADFYGWRVLASDGANKNNAGVSSVAMSVPSFLSVAGSPITGAGTLAVSLVNESANQVFAGPSSGGAAPPTFRLLAAADIPSLSAIYLPLSGGTMTGAILHPDGSAAAPSVGFTGNYGLYYDSATTSLGFALAGGVGGLWSVGTFEIDVAGGGGNAIRLRGESGTNNNVQRFSNDNAAPTFNMAKGRGTIAVPALPVLNDIMGEVIYSGVNAAGALTVTAGARIRATLIETGAVSAAAMGTRLTIQTTPIGSGTTAEVARFENALGFSMFGANVVIDQNRLLRKRVFATLAALTALVTVPADGMCAIIKDALAPAFAAAVVGGGAVEVPVYYNGAAAAWYVG